MDESGQQRDFFSFVSLSLSLSFSLSTKERRRRIRHVIVSLLNGENIARMDIHRSKTTKKKNIRRKMIKWPVGCLRRSIDVFQIMLAGRCSLGESGRLDFSLSRSFSHFIRVLTVYLSGQFDDQCWFIMYTDSDRMRTPSGILSLSLCTYAYITLCCERTTMRTRKNI